MNLRLDVFQLDPEKAELLDQDDAAYYDGLLRKVALILEPLRLDIEIEEAASNEQRVFTMINTLDFGQIELLPIGYTADLKKRMRTLIDAVDFVAVERELRAMVTARNN